MTIRGSACPRCFSRSLSPVSFSLVQQLTSAATQSTEMHRRPRGTSVGECGPWVCEHFEHTRPWLRGPTATRERQPAGRPRPRPAAVGESPRSAGAVMSHGTRSVRGFSCALGGSGARGVASRRAREVRHSAPALSLAAMHTVSACLALGSARRAPGNRASWAGRGAASEMCHLKCRGSLLIIPQNLRGWWRGGCG